MCPILLMTSPPPIDVAMCNRSGNHTGSATLRGDTAEVWQTLMAVYLGAILFLSLTFNGTLCLLFYKKTHLLSISNCFVLNLTVCQLGICVLLLPFSLYAMVSQDLQYTGTGCDIQGYGFTVLIVAQQLALLIISVDRNYAIMNSLRYPNVFTQTLCAVLITFSWLFSLVICAPPLLHSGMGRYTFHKNHFLCSLDWSSENYEYLVTFSVLVFALPISIQGLCYVKIFFAALGHTKRSAKVNPWPGRSSYADAESSTGGSGATDGPNGSMECKAVRTIFIIALAFVICWIPYFTESFLAASGESTSPTFSATAICALFSTGILNPLIYAYMNRVTRREIGRFVCGNSSGNDSDEFASTSMSTHTSNWSSANRIRSRSAGAVPATTEMDTILEETEEVHHYQATPVSPVTMRLTSPCRTSLTEKIVVHTDSHTAINNTEVLVDSTEELADTVKYSTSGKDNKTVTIGKTQVLGDSRWKIVSTEKFKEERSKRTQNQSAEDYYGREQRRKKRDCGSFLFFEHKPTESRSPSSARSKHRVKTRSGRFSLDHNISVNRFPSFMKFKLSLKDADLQNINKVTVESNIEIENKERCGRDTSSSACERPYRSMPASPVSERGSPEGQTSPSNVWHTPASASPSIPKRTISHISQLAETCAWNATSLKHTANLPNVTNLATSRRRALFRSGSFTMGVNRVTSPRVTFKSPTTPPTRRHPSHDSIPEDGSEST